VSRVAASVPVVAERVPKQHRLLHRKVLIRRQLAAIAGDPPGAAYVPFCGDGDLALACWADRPLWAADLDPKRTALFTERFPDARVVTGNCDRWPFPDVPTDTFAVLDLDAWAWPYDAWRAATSTLRLADTFIAVFCDTQMQTCVRVGHWRDPDGTVRTEQVEGTMTPNRVASKIGATWWPRTLRPWIQGEADRLGYTVGGLRMAKVDRTLHWGAVLTRT
jgi:hypothetical protein